MSQSCEELLWYHGKISRDVATQTLLRGGRRDGYFLIRDCSSAVGDYVLSLYRRNQVMHFQVHCLGDNKFAIDDGPVFHGLDSLTAHYKTNPDRLPCQLIGFCPGKMPPLSTLKYGIQTKLHTACMERNINVVRQLLQDPTVRKDINSRNTQGLTPLHLASAKGDNEIVSALLTAGAEASAADSNGKTAVQVNLVYQMSISVEELYRECVLVHMYITSNFSFI